MADSLRTPNRARHVVQLIENSESSTGGAVTVKGGRDRPGRSSRSAQCTTNLNSSAPLRISASIWTVSLPE